MADEVIRDIPRYPVRPVTGFSEILNRLSWSAVWAGVMIALGMEVLLTFFGLSIGFRMFHWDAANPWSGISAWSTIWYFVTMAWSMFFGAWCAARLSGNQLRESGMLHGMTVWGLASVATILITALGAWSVLREGIDTLGTAALTTGQVPAVGSQALNQMQANAGPTVQATANAISRFALGTWIGMLIGFIAALLGGLAGRLRGVAFPAQETPGSTRLAA